MSTTDTTRSGRGLTAAEAAEYLGVTVGTLAKWRLRGEGPPYSAAFKKHPRYNSADLDAFLWGNVVTNTAEAATVRKTAGRAGTP